MARAHDDMVPRGCRLGEGGHIDCRDVDLWLDDPGGPAQTYIYATLEQLPFDVRRFALHHCIFSTLGRASSTCLEYATLPTENDWLHRECVAQERRERGETEPHRRFLILFDEWMSPENSHGVIAYRIAEAWLTHTAPARKAAGEMFRASSMKLVALGEGRGDYPIWLEHVEAAELARDWGFRGVGADPEHWRDAR